MCRALNAMRNNKNISIKLFFCFILLIFQIHKTEEEQKKEKKRRRANAFK